MGLRGLALMASCLCALLATSSAEAQLGAPRWYAQETGILVPQGNSGLVEVSPPESLQSVGHVSVIVGKAESACLAKDQQSIENPSEGLLPGTGEMEEFELVCEEGTGPGPNNAAPFPCVTRGEAFEVKGVNLNWPGTLEIGGVKRTGSKRSKTSTTARRVRKTTRHRGKARGATKIRDLPKYYENFTGVDLEIYCLKSKASGQYTGTLRPEVAVGRLNFRGTESGELVEASSGRYLSLKGNDWFASRRFKDVRVNSEYD